MLKYIFKYTNFFMYQKLALFSQEFLELRILIRGSNYFVNMIVIYETTIIGMVKNWSLGLLVLQL